VLIAGTDVVLRALTVADSETAVKLAGAATRVTLTAPAISGGYDGLLITRRAAQITLTDPQISDVAHNGIQTSLAGMRISGGRIRGAGTAINAIAATWIDATTIDSVNEGVHVASATVVHGDRIDITATNSGIKVDPGGEFVLTDSQVRGREALCGTITQLGNNYIGPPLFPWLRAMGILVIAAALALQLLHMARSRRLDHQPATEVGRGRPGPGRLAQAASAPHLPLMFPTPEPVEPQRPRPLPSSRSAARSPSRATTPSARHRSRGYAPSASSSSPPRSPSS